MSPLWIPLWAVKAIQGHLTPLNRLESFPHHEVWLNQNQDEYVRWNVKESWELSSAFFIHQRLFVFAQQRCHDLVTEHFQYWNAMNFKRNFCQKLNCNLKFWLETVKKQHRVLKAQLFVCHFVCCFFLDGYNPKSRTHHSLLLCLLMTSCDLSDQTKGWKTTRKIAVSWLDAPMFKYTHNTPNML